MQNGKLLEIVIENKRLLEYKCKTLLQHKIDHKDIISDRFFLENFDEWYPEHLERQKIIY